MVNSITPHTKTQLLWNFDSNNNVDEVNMGDICPSCKTASLDEDFEDETVEDFKDDKEVLPTSAGLGVDYKELGRCLNFTLPTYDRG